MSTMPASLEIFYSSAATNESLHYELEKHRSWLKHEGFIITWQMRQIIASTNLADVFNRPLNIASVLLLLISANFVASDYCSSIEMRRVMQWHGTNSEPLSYSVPGYLEYPLSTQSGEPFLLFDIHPFQFARVELIIYLKVLR
jgi:hypothetical protein